MHFGPIYDKEQLLITKAPFFLHIILLVLVPICQGWVVCSPELRMLSPPPWVCLILLAHNLLQGLLQHMIQAGIIMFLEVTHLATGISGLMEFVCHVLQDPLRLVLVHLLTK